MKLCSGRLERFPYSLSRWTDVPASKWDWFKVQLGRGYFTGFNPKTSIPAHWSLYPEDVLGLVFWTRNPENLIRDEAVLKPYPLVVHTTLTGWVEVERGAPDIDQGISLMRRAIETFGPSRVTWRFSPVPLVIDVLDRFEKIARQIGPVAPGLPVYLSFLQENDRVPETRTLRMRSEITRHLMRISTENNLNLGVCQEDKVAHNILGSGRVCESGHRFKNRMYDYGRGCFYEGCGCALAVDPFTVNESCRYGCLYCYAADKNLSSRKRNTAK